MSLKNRVERIIFARICKETNENFDHSIFSDETTVQMDTNANRIWYKKFPDETRIGLIGQYKHPTSFYCIGAISRRGPSQLLVFDGHLNGPGFRDACESFLVPFIEETFPDFHMLHMDNAPSHAAGATSAYMRDAGIFHFKTPAQ